MDGIMFTAMSMVVLMVLIGAIMAAMPWIVSGTECFTITIPASAVGDSRLVSLKKRYTILVGLLTLCAVGVSLAASTFLSWGDAGMAISTAAVLVLSFAPFFVMLGFRSRVAKIKESEGWKTEGQISLSAVGEADMPRPLSVAWELLHLPIIGCSAALAAALLPKMEDRVPIHFDAAWVANGWVDKGPAVILLPVLTTLFLAACMTFVHASIASSKRWASPDAPAVSAYAYAAYARVQSIVVVVAGLIFCASMGLMSLCMVHPDWAIAWSVLMSIEAVGMVLAFLVVAVRYGQGGSRLAARLVSSAAAGTIKDGAASQSVAGAPMQRDDDRYWKAGVFYVNRNDPAIFLPKRFGVGWTFNMGNPVAWLVFIGFMVLSVGFVVAVATLF